MSGRRVVRRRWTPQLQVAFAGSHILSPDGTLWALPCSCRRMRDHLVDAEWRRRRAAATRQQPLRPPTDQRDPARRAPRPAPRRRRLDVGEDRTGRRSRSKQPSVPKASSGSGVDGTGATRRRPRPTPNPLDAAGRRDPGRRRPANGRGTKSSPAAWQTDRCGPTASPPTSLPALSDPTGQYVADGRLDNVNSENLIIDGHRAFVTVSINARAPDDSAATLTYDIELWRATNSYVWLVALAGLGPDPSSGAARHSFTRHPRCPPQLAPPERVHRPAARPIRRVLGGGVLTSNGTSSAPDVGGRPGPVAVQQPGQPGLHPTVDARCRPEYMPTSSPWRRQQQDDVLTTPAVFGRGLGQASFGMSPMSGRRTLSSSSGSMGGPLPIQARRTEPPSCRCSGSDSTKRARRGSSVASTLGTRR
jgi:hypothetical protein